jgi:type IV pilus assembly protein PilM
MLNSKSLLAADFGAGTLKLAEFEQNEAGGLRLLDFTVKSLGGEGAQEATREGAISKALQLAVAEKSFATKAINVCAPGFHVFSKFVKLPPVDTSKVTQIIQYEAQQNVPFPLEEVVWDYQILGTSAGGELEVLLVAIKTEVVEGLFRVAESAGKRLQLVDVSPAALCNAFRYNYSDLEGCAMLLDIGAKTSNLLFFEKNKVYARTIPIGANSITQDFANETKMKFDEAELIKIEKGMVGLGGAYEEPADPHAAAISKISRQVFTRLHIQVNQTIQFYRGQQGGSAPQQLFLSGGASVMTYASQFFAEKLNLPVDYFNPFRNVELPDAVDKEQLAGVAHQFGEVVGLGLRNLAHCPVELNLMPKSIRQREQFSSKKPYFIAAVFSLVLVVAAIGYAFQRIADIKKEELGKLKMNVEPLMQKDGQVTEAKSALDRLKRDSDKTAELIQSRFYWNNLIAELRRVLIQAEAKTKEKLAKQSPNIEVGVWIENFNPLIPASMGEVSAPRPVAMVANPDAPEGSIPGVSPTPGPQPRPAVAAGSENEINMITIVCRGVNLSKVVPSANIDLAYALQAEAKSSSFFVPEGTELVGETREDTATPTFVFNMNLKLKRPFKFNHAVD